MSLKDVTLCTYRANSIKLERKDWLSRFRDFATAAKSGQMVKMRKSVTVENFNALEEERIMAFIQGHYGHEVFTPGLIRSYPIYKQFIEHFTEARTKVVTIAGTNGKGQTAHTLAKFLEVKKHSFAMWTSPHILSIRERFYFVIKGEVSALSYQNLYDTLEESHLYLRKEFPDVRISFYEFLFFVFLKKAAEAGLLNYLLLEVGIGGKLDAVNHFNADCSCITSISRDHQAILGRTYKEILLEKIAISRRDKPLFTQFQLDYLNTITKKYAEQHQINWTALAPLGKADYFLENQFMAWSVFSFLEPDHGIPFHDSVKLVPAFKGRREIMTFKTKSLIFIGAHNIDGIRKMLESEGETQALGIQTVMASFSKRPLEEVTHMLKGLEEYFCKKAKINVAQFDHPKAINAEDIKSAMNAANKGMLNFVTDWKNELQTSDAETILVCGSYYFIGEVQRFLLSHRDS